MNTTTTPRPEGQAQHNIDCLTADIAKILWRANIRGDDYLSSVKAVRELIVQHLRATPQAAAAGEAVQQGIEALRDICGVMSESKGIAGYHLNGDVFNWDEGSDPLDPKLPNALAALEEIASLAGQPGKGATEDYWAGYRARLDEETTVRPEPANPTLWRYLENAREKLITFHTIGVNRMPDGGFHIYIHPQSVSGETEDYLIWPDPFDHSDMIVNKKDSPKPDVEAFKAFLAKRIAARSPASNDKEQT
jgi:hypothetical protein